MHVLATSEENSRKGENAVQLKRYLPLGSSTEASKPPTLVGGRHPPY